MTLPDKLTKEDTILTGHAMIGIYWDECEEEEGRDEIIKRYNNYTKLDEIRILLGNIITELEQENEELKEGLRQEKTHTHNNYVMLKDTLIQYNKLRDAIKNRQEQLHDYNLRVFKQLKEHKISLGESIEKQRTYNGEIKELQSILDSVENEI